MALLGFDGFEGIETADALLRGWTFGTSGSPVITGGTRAFDANGLHGDRSSFIGRSVPATTTQFVLGFAFRTVGNPGQEIAFAKLFGGGAEHLTLTISTGGEIVIRRGGRGGTELARSAVGTISYDAWNYVELVALINDTTGFAVVYLNGDPVSPVSYTGDTRNGGSAQIDGFRLCCEASGDGRTTRFDDVYWLDDTGAELTDRLGPVRVQAVVPTSDVAADFTRSAGASNFGTVDEALPNNDTDYNASSTPGHQDVFGVGALSGPIGQVFAVQTRVRARKTDTGAVTLTPSVISDAVEEDGAPRVLGASYAEYTDIFPNDPSTSEPWDPADVAAAQVAYRIPT
jgi:hypothetical protein